jgi:hypothetical protein
MDMTHAFISAIWSPELAEGIAKGCEYEPHRDASVDPFAQVYKI